MKYLNQTESNKNFFIKQRLLYNVNSDLPIADLSNGQYLQENATSKMKETVEFFESGARVTIECNGETCIQFFDNSGQKLAETFCHKGQDRESISILPIDLGVFSSHAVGRNKIEYEFIDYRNHKIIRDENFSKVYKEVESRIERKNIARAKFGKADAIRQAISNFGREKVFEGAV